MNQWLAAPKGNIPLPLLTASSFTEQRHIFEAERRRRWGRREGSWNNIQDR
jgi:hypothetical protein